MKTFRSSLNLFVLTALIGSYAYFVEYKGGEKKEKAKEESLRLFPASAADQADRIVLTWVAAKTVLVKEGGTWKITEPIQDLADPTAVETLLTGLREEKSEVTVVEGEALDLSKFGLQSPLGTIEVSGGGSTHRIEFGTVDGIGGVKYVHLPAQKKIVTVGSFAQTRFQKTARDLREKKIMAFEPSEIQSFDYKGTLNFKVSKTEGAWSVEGKSWKLDEAKVTGFLQEVANVRASEVVSESKTADPKKFGLSQTVSRVAVKRADGSEQILNLHPIKDGKLYLTREDRPPVFEVPSATAENLKLTELKLRDTKFPFKFDPALVANIDIRSSVSKLSLKRESGNWVVQGSDEKRKLSESKIQGLLTALGSLEAKEFTKQVKGQVLGSVELKKEDGATVLKLEYGRDVGTEQQVVTTNLTPDVMLVSKSAIAGLPLQDLFEDPPKPGDVTVQEESKEGDK